MQELRPNSFVGSAAGSVSGIVTARAPVVANTAWCHELAGQGGRAGTGGHCEHAVREGWSAKGAESFGFPPGSFTWSSTVASATRRYEIYECVVASADFLPASIQVRVS